MRTLDTSPLTHPTKIADPSFLLLVAGIRPKITGPGEPSRDFLVQGTAEHGVQGLINLYGIESPGLTSSLALGGYVADLACGSIYPRL